MRILVVEDDAETAAYVSNGIVEEGHIAETVADGVDGFLVPPGDPTALAGRILDVLTMGEERKAMGRRGRAKATCSTN